jgi:Ca-activated chloride channel family protein
MPAPLELNTTWNLDPLPAGDQPSIAYLLVDILDPSSSVAAPADASAAPGPLAGANKLNISLVLDTSGSMAGAKLQNLKTAVRWVVDHLSPEDTVAVTFFDDEVHPLIPSTRADGARDLLEKVDAVREAGGTAMSKGLLVGLDEAIKGSGPGTVSRIILLTDGQTWGDADRCKELGAQAGAAGIPVTALGVGAEDDWSIELLDAIATASGGLSDYIAKPEETAGAFRGTILAMQQTVARNLRLTFNPSAGVAARAVYRVSPLISKLWPTQDEVGEAAQASSPPQQGGALQIPLGDVQSGTAQAVLFDVVLPARKPGEYRLARLTLQYETSAGPQAQAPIEVALDVVSTFASGAGRGPGNPRVMNSVEKATAFKLQTRALQAGMLGDVANATRNLRAAATRLLNLGETELAEEAELQARLLETRGEMSPAGTKKLAYETRKLAVAESEAARPSTVRFEEEEGAPAPASETAPASVAEQEQEPPGTE